MGDISTLIVEELAKRKRAAQAQQRQPGPQPNVVARPAEQPPPVAAPSAGTVARMQAAATAGSGLLDPGAPVTPAAPLLRAFSGGPELVAGIVLAEALAPPIALREPGKPFGSGPRS